MSEEEKSKQAGKPEPQPGEDAEQPAGESPKTPPKAAAPAKKPVKKPARPVKKGPIYEDLKDDLLQKLTEKFEDGVVSGQSFLGQPNYTVDLNCLYDVMIFLRDRPELNFDYLVDVTALDQLGDEKRFVMVYHLYSHKNHRFIRVKAKVAVDDLVPSVTSIWKTAGWLEREVYDLFGIEFSGHPDLKRILLPDDWHGHPLRKDYDIKLQDQAWIKSHLHIRKTPS